MIIGLSGGASTQSRGRRPLPSGVVRAVSLTEHSIGPYELVEFTRKDGSTYRRQLLSWVGGQWGGLWGAGPFPSEVMRDLAKWEVQGSYGNHAEYRLADALGEVYMPYINGGGDLGVRFFQNGGDATAAAVRIARGATGRDAIASYGYHGAALDFAHEPDYRGQTPYNVKQCRQFEWGDSSGLRQTLDFLSALNHNPAACVIVEVPALDDEAVIGAFLRECRVMCDDYGISLILDEVVTGFRLGLAGACERYNVKPDLVCLGKAMSAIGGVSAIIGRRDLVDQLDSGTFFSTTFGGDPMRCSIAEKTIRFLQRERLGIYGTPEQRGRLWSIGQALKDGLNERGVVCIGQPERSILKFDTDADWLAFCSKMIERDVMIHRPQFSSLAHSEKDIVRTLAAVDRVMDSA